MKLPQHFIDYTTSIFGTERWQRFINSFSQMSDVSIRLNPWKLPNNILFSDIASIPWCKNAYWLKERPHFTLDPLLHAGVYYVQEAGSMFLDQALKQYVTSPVSALDLCAAPGGKSTLMRAALPDGSAMISNETDRRRANILLENMLKQGHPDVLVTNNYARDFQRSNLLFDIIIADVPCSGEGMFRREGVIEEGNLANVRHCQQRQRNIIKDIWPCLRSGGLLIYSTCTFNLHENEENVRWIVEELGAQILPVQTDPAWNITGSLLPDWHYPVYRFIPGITRSEGFFMAVLQKQPNESSGDPLQATDPQLLRTKAKAMRNLYILSDGIPVSEPRGKDLIPSPAEALSIHSSPHSYPRVELSLEEARRYLHREALRLPPDTPSGYVLVTYQYHPLGFMKNLGDRANNLYPKNWAIRNL